MESNDSHSLVCFGPYEVDLRTQEIRKHGTLIRLQGQPFQILEMLLAHPRELITRDELQQRLWPGESLVDCTHGLNAAVNKLREALGDSAITPLYVETLPRRAYRFIGTLRVQSPEAQETVSASSLTPDEFPTSLSPNSDSASTPNTRTMPPTASILSRQWTIALVSVVALVIGGFGGMALSPRFHSQVSEKTQPTSLSSRKLAALEEKEQSERHAIAPESSRRDSARVVRALTRPAILRDPALNSPHKDPTLRTVVSGSGSAGPQFSPDGKHIAFMSNRTGPWQIWVSSVDGSNPVQISSTESAGTPRWSPNGKYIVFDAPCDQGTCVFIASIARPEPARQLNEGFVPSFSRDGKWVYFASERSNDWQVWKVPARGGLAVEMTRQGGFAAFESSDGYLYYAKSRDAEPELWRIRLRGGEESRVSTRIRPRTWASWTVTQKGILFASDAPGKGSQLNLYDTATGQIRPLLSLPTSPFWMGATADGRRVAINDTAERQITLVENLR